MSLVDKGPVGLDKVELELLVEGLLCTRHRSKVINKIELFRGA